MPEQNGFSLLEQRSKLLLDTLRQLHFQCQRQKDLLEKANPEDIQDFATRKQTLIKTFTALTSDIHNLYGKQTSLPSLDKKKADQIISECERESRPLIDEIVKIETQDRLIFNKLKDIVSNEIEEIKKARAKLDTLNSSYILNAKGPTLFDQRT
jgi:hypothetical protein